VTFDWAGIGMTPEAAALLAGWVLMCDKIIKLAMNVTRDGSKGCLQQGMSAFQARYLYAALAQHHRHSI